MPQCSFIHKISGKTGLFIANLRINNGFAIKLFENDPVSCLVLFLPFSYIVCNDFSYRVFLLPNYTFTANYDYCRIKLFLSYFLQELSNFSSPNC